MHIRGYWGTTSDLAENALLRFTLCIKCYQPAWLICAFAVHLFVLAYIGAGMTLL